MQNFAAGLVTDSRKFDYSIFLLTQLITVNEKVMTFKCLGGLASTCLLNNTGSKDMLRILFHDSAAGQISFIYSLKNLHNVCSRIC